MFNIGDVTLYCCRYEKRPRCKGVTGFFESLMTAFNAQKVVLLGP